MEHDEFTNEGKIEFDEVDEVPEDVPDKEVLCD